MRLLYLAIIFAIGLASPLTGYVSIYSRHLAKGLVRQWLLIGTDQWICLSADSSIGGIEHLISVRVAK